MSEQLFKPSSNRLTFATVQSESKRLHALLNEQNTSLFRLDLHDVTQCDSAGLALIIETKRLCKQHNRALSIDGVTKAIYALAEFCGVEALLK